MKVLCVGTTEFGRLMMAMIEAEKPRWEGIATDDLAWALNTAKKNLDINTVMLDGTTMTEQGIAIVKEIKSILPKAQFVGFSKEIPSLGKLDGVGCDKVTSDLDPSIFRIIIED